MDSKEKVKLHPVLVVDDDPVVRQRLQSILQGLIHPDASIAVAVDSATAKAQLQAHTFALALVDIGLPDGSGVDLIRWMQVHCPRITALVISAWGCEDTVLAALRAGAIGYLLKERDDIELRLALVSVRRGGAPIDPAIARRILDDMVKNAQPSAESGNAGPPLLSEREVEVLNMVSRGYSNREIAEMTSLSRFTIEGYTKSIYRKLSVGSRTAAVFEAKALGLLH